MVFRLLPDQVAVGPGAPQGPDVEDRCFKACSLVSERIKLLTLEGTGDPAGLW